MCTKVAKSMLLKSLTFPLLFLLFLDLAASSSASRAQFTYDGFAGANLTIDGAAAVTASGLLRLTNAIYPAKGHAFHSAPLDFRAPLNGGVLSFSTTFVFGIVPAFVQVSDHGLAFVISRSRDLSAARPAQYLGLLNESSNGRASSHIFAVELDTILNPEFKDMDSNHVGIDINSLESLQAHTAGYNDDKTGAFHGLSLMSGEAMQVWVDYDGLSMELRVTMAPAEASKPMKPLISTVVDLSAVLRDPAYVGFSSSTGAVNSSHYVLGWSFAMNGVAPAIDYSKLPKLPRVARKAKSHVWEITVPIIATVFPVALLAAASLFMWRRFQYAELREDWEVEFGPHRFSYKDLFHATEGFKNEQVLGTGGFGSVYKGVLRSSNLEVAVKKVSHDSKQGMKEFIAEVVSIGRLRHRNLVQLLGYCRRKGELLLVYDYMPNGSLDKFLYDRNKPILDWATRLRIMKGVASGLCYLHVDWEQVVIHRDIKASNVLLDGEMNARLGDFGLARLYDHGAHPKATNVVGTLGYLAPELVRTGRATPFTDVFAFGVFLLEVTCGRRPLEQDVTSDQLVLVDWVLELWCKGSIADAVDEKLGGEYDIEEAKVVLQLGLLCLHPLPTARPTIRQVMHYLNGDVPLPELPPLYVNLSPVSLMQSQGLSSQVVPQSRFAMSFATMSSLSGGR